PSEPNTPLRHATTPPSFGGVPPFSMPHLSSFVSHTPLWQTRWPFPGVHLPLIGVTDGMGEPFGTFGSQTPRPSHHATPPQSASVPHFGEHPPPTQYGPAC